MSEGYVFLVKGGADKRFIENIIVPEVDHRKTNVIEYSEDPDTHVNDLIYAFHGMYRDLYLLRDFDFGKQGCSTISDRKDFVEGKFGELNRDEIIIVKDEIEGWYLAGIRKKDEKRFGISVPNNTENIGKRAFKEKLGNSNFSSSINFQQEIIKSYSIKLAKRKNSSFDYFTEELRL